jgi:hypothetical protein
MRKDLNLKGGGFYLDRGLHPLTIYVSTPTLRALKEISENEERSLQKVIRRYLEKLTNTQTIDNKR